MAPPLRSLDLFSGIGGLTLALEGVARPMAYCEIEPAAVAVLLDRMTRGSLPRAPICPDVRLMTPQWVHEHASGTPQAIVAGFPCIGFSLAGKRNGYQNEQSGLFSHILRLLDEHQSIQFLFLENVSQFLHDGLGRAVNELHNKRRFDLRWCLAEARDVGAPQRRRRWFCFGCKPWHLLGHSDLMIMKHMLDVGNWNPGTALPAPVDWWQRPRATARTPRPKAPVLGHRYLATPSRLTALGLRCCT